MKRLPVFPAFCALVFATRVLADPVDLTLKPSTITVQGRPAPVFALEQNDGQRGLTVEQKDGFHVRLHNATSVPTTIHWHGLILPNFEDGVPWVTQEPIPPGGSREYKFPLVQHGTYWMHSHYGLQEQALASAPLIILNDAERAKADREAVVSFSDFSFTRPGEILAALRKPEAAATPMEMKEAGPMKTMPSLVQVWEEKAGRFTTKEVAAPRPDIDVAYDALLANRRTLDDPEVVTVKPGETVLLRIIAASSATNFFVGTGALEAELLAVDGQEISPLRGNFFQLAIAQRIDLRVRIPDSGGAFPILGLGEGTRLRAGIILATEGVKIPKMTGESPMAAGGLDNTQESRLRATQPLAAKAVDRELPSDLGGNMKAYVWTINGQAYPNRSALAVKEGERVQMTISNQTMMSHPMHLHGHDFCVVEIDGKPLAGARRDTVLIPPGGVTKIQFDANNPGIWAYHCHVLYHLATGMFTVLLYDGADTRWWQPEKTPTELAEPLP